MYCTALLNLPLQLFLHFYGGSETGVTCVTHTEQKQGAFTIGFLYDARGE